MRFYAVSGSAARQRTDCAIVGVYESGTLSTAAAQLDSVIGGRLSRLVKRGDLRGKTGESALLDIERGPCQRVLAVGLGRKESFGRKQYKKALLAAAAAVAKTGARDALSHLSQEPVAETDAYYRGRLAAESVGHALYRVPALRSSRALPEPSLRSFGIALPEREQCKDAERGLAHGRGIAAGTALSRNLANLPANVCTPSHLGQRARELAREHRSIRVQVLGEPELKRLKMGSFLSVTAGTDEHYRRLTVLMEQPELFTDERFISSIARTLYFTVLAVLLPMVFGIAAAVVFHRRFPLRGLLRTIERNTTSNSMPWNASTVPNRRRSATRPLGSNNSR